ncbi:uncharacterized protein [Antedon mediterranea]|uniref:uncharacterized protein n=1 Tax=Antedon mediterranea TaxID=105859 RepID=UPI003AF551C1
MEDTMLQSSGKIIRHNTQLLKDDIDIMKDSLDDNRPNTSETRSSEESRLMDGSPDKYEDAGSEGSIETEKQYQEDLKERVKRSFAELGLNPDEIPQNRERSISPTDSLDKDYKDNDENDDVLRDSIEDNYKQKEDNNKFVIPKYEAYPAGPQPVEDNKEELNKNYSTEKQEQVLQYNNNNSGGIIDNDNDENDNSDYQHHTTLPINDYLQLGKNSGNSLQQNQETNQHFSGLNPHVELNSRTRSAEKTFSPVNSPVSVSKPPSGKTIISSASKKKESKNDLVETLPGGEKVRVEYISDDSGDDDEHYVDEKGSPIHFDADAKEKARQQMYKIKPRPPATPVDSAKKSSQLRRYSLERQKTPSKDQLSTDAGILSIEKVPDSYEEPLITTSHTAGSGQLDGSIPNLMNDDTSRNASALSEKSAESTRKFVDAEVYAKLQLKSQQKIKNREASTDRKKGSGKTHQTTSRHSSSKGVKSERPSRNTSTSKIQRQLEDKRNTPLPINNDKHYYNENTHTDTQLENERVKVESDHNQQNDSLVEGQPVASEMPYKQQEYQQTVNQQSYAGHMQSPQNPAHPIQPAYHQLIPVQQQPQHIPYSQIPYQGPVPQFQYPPGTYQGPIQQQHHPVPYHGPLVYQYGNGSQIYQSNQQNQLNLHNHQHNQSAVNFMPSYPDNQLIHHANQSQQQGQLAFHSSHMYPSPHPAQQQFYQELQHQQYQHMSHPQMNVQFGIQHFEQHQQQEEEIPPLDLRGIDEDYPQQQARNSPQANVSNRKKNMDKINFIEQNKVKLRKDLPQRGYLDRYKQDINPKKPLPSISRTNSEDSYDNWPQTEDEQTWITDPGTDRRRFMELPRQQSDTAVRYSNTDLRNSLSDNQIQSAPVDFQTRTLHHPHHESESPSWPQFNTDEESHIQFTSFSADHATSYARMQYKPKVMSKFESSPWSSIQRPGPYPVLPNITDTDELRKSEDGYLAKLQKAKKEPQYKKYTLKDYQKLKVDTRLGGLGPDTEATQEKKEKSNRQREYARQVMIKNRKAFKQLKTQNWMPSPESPQEKGPTKRDIAIEYSKRVPKPRLPTPPEEKHERIYGASDRNVDTTNEMKLLEQLRLRHEKEKQEVEKLKSEIRT